MGSSVKSQFCEIPCCQLCIVCQGPVCVLFVSCLCPVCVLFVSCLCPVCVLFVSCLCPVCVLFVSCLCVPSHQTWWLFKLDDPIRIIKTHDSFSCFYSQDFLSVKSCECYP